MKYAKVKEVRGFAVADTSPVSEGNITKRKRIEDLLRKYPRTTEAETLEIRHFLATASHLDVGLLSGSDEFRETVRAFKKEHSSHFRLKVHEVVLFLLIIGGPIAALLWRNLA